MNRKLRSQIWLVGLAAGSLLLTLALMCSASATAPGALADNRPTLPPERSTLTPQPSSPGAAGGGTGFLAEIDGFVWENGDTSRPLSGVRVRYTSDGVSGEATTDKDGYFKLVNIGPDPGTLDLADSAWQSGTGGVVLKPPVGQRIRVNLAALPRNRSLSSQVTLRVGAFSPSAAAGQTVTFTLKVVNGTQNAVSGLILGDQLPDGMTVAGVTTSRGDVWGRGPSVVMVDLNTMAAGDSATVNILALVDTNARASQATNRATLAYREGSAIAAQVAINLTGGPTTLPVTGMGVPVAISIVLVVVLFIAHRLRTRSAV